MLNPLKESYQGKKVLVTGHTGFKGTWLCLWLHSLGAKVVGIALDPISDNNLYDMTTLAKDILDYRLDIRDQGSLSTVIETEQPDFIFHLAAQALVIEGYDNPLETFEVNAQGTVNLLEAVRKANISTTLILVTTDKVYQNKEWIWPYRENDRLGGYDPYSASKACAELVISSYRNSFFNEKAYDQHQVSISSVRAGNVIGGGDWAKNRLLPDCINALQLGQPIVLRNPNAVRPWQHVLEPLGGYLLLGIKMGKYPQSYSEAWNFGPLNQNIINVKTLVNKIIESYGNGEWKDISDKDQRHEAQLLSLDINKANHRLNWMPILSIDQTVSLTVEWYQKFTDENAQELCLGQIQQYSELWNALNEN